MSFSSEVKEELVKKTDSARHCQIAEFAAFMGMSGNVSETDNKVSCFHLLFQNALQIHDSNVDNFLSKNVPLFA